MTIERVNTPIVSITYRRTVQKRTLLITVVCFCCVKPRRKKRAPAFDAAVFLKETGAGRTLVNLRKNQVLFSQGDAADAVFYIQKGSVKLCVVSQRGKEA